MKVAAGEETRSGCFSLIYFRSFDVFICAISSCSVSHLANLASLCPQTQMSVVEHY